MDQRTFGFGVLQELRDTPCCRVEKTSNLLDAVNVVSGVSGGSIVAAYRRLVLVTVNAERDPARRSDDSEGVPNTLEVVDALLFGAGNRATVETQEFLVDIARRWQDDLRRGRRDSLSSFAADAEIFLIQVNLRDAPQGERRRRLLQVPTAFSISDSEVTTLIEAGREVLRGSKVFQALKRSLQEGAR